MQVRSMGPISEMDMVSFIFLSTGNSLRITYHIININLKISRVTSWIATSVSPGWIRDSLLLDIRLLNMHHYSIVYSFRSSTFEATNYEKSNDKRLSAPPPLLICSTTCVWSLKSGGYGGEGRRLMSIWPTTILQPPFFRNFGGMKFSTFDFQSEEVVRDCWKQISLLNLFSGRRVYKSKLCQEKWQISPQFQAVETHLKKN